MPPLARACGRDAAENLEDVDVRASRFAGRRCAAGSGHAWLHDRRQAPRRASTLQLDEDGRAWSRRDDLSSPDRPPSSESATEPPRRTDGRGASGLPGRRRRSHNLLMAPGSLAISPRYSTAPERPLSATATRNPFFVNIQAN